MTVSLSSFLDSKAAAAAAAAAARWATQGAESENRCESVDQV